MICGKRFSSTSRVSSIFPAMARQRVFCLEDANRGAKLVHADQLRDFLAQFPYVQCVVLNACYTDKQAAMIAEKVEYVVGMRPRSAQKPRWVLPQHFMALWRAGALQEGI